MIRQRAFASGLLALTVSTISFAAGFPPWEFGMSHEQVVGIKEFGPYKTFANGDLETFNGVFNGRKENIQFFFHNNGLHRVAVYLYEGTDLAAAMSRWIDCHQILARLYGTIEIPGFDASGPGKPAGIEDVAFEVKKKVATGIKVQMAPIQQPEKFFVYSSFWQGESQGAVFYLTIYFDPPHH
jgi:hypothetical protein